jgi:hypothetical protein
VVESETGGASADGALTQGGEHQEQRWSAPEEVRTFLCEQVRSPVGLEVLRLLVSSPDRRWSPEDLAQHLRIAARVVEGSLGPLLAVGLAIQTPDRSKVQYRSNAQTHELVRCALLAYREHRLEVMGILNSSAVTRVRLRLDLLADELLRPRRDAPPGGRRP